MNKYLVTVRVRGQQVKKTLEADSVTHARLLAEWLWGISSVLSTPVKLEEADNAATPQQQRINQLKQQLDSAKKSAKLAKLSQQQQRINQQRSKIYSK